MSRPGSFTPHSAICNAPMRGVPPRVHPPKPYTDVRFRVGASPKTAATPDFPRRQSGESGLPPRNAPPDAYGSGSACRLSAHGMPPAPHGGCPRKGVGRRQIRGMPMRSCGPARQPCGALPAGRFRDIKDQRTR